MAYVQLAQLTGCASTAQLLHDICRRLPLVGGADHDGHHWIWLSAREASEVLNCARNTAAAALKRLVEAGFLIREKLGENQRYGRNRSWYYRPGPQCPEFLLGKPVRTRRAPSCSTAAQSSRTTFKNHQQKRVANAQNEQPCAHAPDAEATQKLIKQQEALVVGDPVKGLQQAREMMRRGAPVPAETAETQVETSVVQSSGRISPPSPGQSQLPGKDQPHPEQASSAVCGSLAFDQLGVSALAPDRGLNQPYPPSFSFSR